MEGGSWGEYSIQVGKEARREVISKQGNRGIVNRPVYLPTCLLVYLFPYSLQHLLHITVMSQIMDIQHLDHFADGGHTQEGMAALLFQI